MELETGTRAIISLAWARRLGLPDSALHFAAMGESAARVLAPDDDAESVVFLRLLRGSALAGPAWFLDAAKDVGDDELAQESTLVRLIRDNIGSHDARGTGEYSLYYLDEPLDVAPSESTVVSFEPGHAAELENKCPSDDLAGVALSRRGHTFTLLADDGHAPLAGAGYDVWEGLIADVTAITAPSLRRHGLGSYISAVAADEALTQGLVPQWRAGLSHRAAHQTANSLGFVLAGSVTGARIGLPPAPPAGQERS
ncbi:GNAT family N-acetyltransferase [Arthrobacter sp. KK5.5]|uniref:GNAT family N-acetyltransferase n=1 Tax=Arthrobacter sp. KK5.5 TaxID=3373084 RepID=UPI003EE57791